MFVSGVIYSLKKQYPSSITLSTISNAVVDYRTGQQTSNTNTLYIPKVIKMPVDTMRNLSTQGIDPAFSYDGYFDQDDSVILIDNADLGDYVITQDTKVRIKGIDYNIKKSTNIANAATMLLVRSIKHG